MRDTHAGPFEKNLPDTFRRMAQHIGWRMKEFGRMKPGEISDQCSAQAIRLSPRFASPAIARARVGDAFSDSGRSRRIPSFAAYSLNAMSTS